MHHQFLFGAAIGIALDQLITEPPDQFHPVAWFGRTMQRVEGLLYRDSRVYGIVHTAIGVSLGCGAGVMVRSSALATTLAIAERELVRTATKVEEALETGDLAHARALLPSLVGRDPHLLDEYEISRAVVESVAENTVDAAIAPAFWAALAGAPGALMCRAINTLDSMVGHHSLRYENYGWASARLDDAIAFVPARIVAVIVALLRPKMAPEVYRVVRAGARFHPSPNAGVAEAAFAGALGLRLGGTNLYDHHHEDRPILGSGRRPVSTDIGRAIVLSQQVVCAFATFLTLVGVSLTPGSES